MTWILSRMTVWQKLVTISAVFILPISVLLYMIAHVTTGDIEFAQYERYGNEYQRPLEDLLELVPQHMAEARRQSDGNESSKANVAALRSKIDAAMESLAATDRKLGAILQFTDQGFQKRKRERITAETVSAEWRDIKDSVSSLKADRSKELHTHLIASIRAMIDYAGDTSKLILDPDLDSYYLMSVTLVNLPQTQDRLAAVTALAADILRRKSISAAERRELGVAAAMLKESDLSPIITYSEKALVEDANFYGVCEQFQKDLPPVFHNYVTAAEAYNEMILKIAQSDNLTVTPGECLAMGSKVRDASFAFWRTAVNDLNALLQARIDAKVSERLWCFVWTGLALIIAMALVYSIATSINGPLNRIIANLNVSGEQVVSSTRQMAVASQELATGASEQAASIEETSSSLEEISAMTTKNAQNAGRARELAARVGVASKTGTEVMQEMNEVVAGIKSSSDEVGKIIKTIDEIAFQTNLLALNAAVEAARAGDSGRGFAVVADEVRRLAQRSAAAAKESTAKIEEAVTKSALGVATATKVSAALNEIDVNVKDATNLVGEIAVASEEQAQGIRQINQAVQQMDKVVQGNAASAEQSASVAEEMLDHAQAVQDAVRKLGGLVGASRSAQAPDRESSSGINLNGKISTNRLTAARTRMPAELVTPN